MKRTVRNRSYMLFFNLKCVGTTASEFSRLPASFSVRGLCTIGAWALHHPFGSQARCVQRLRTILDGIPLRREMAEVMVSLFSFSVTPTLLGDNCPENYSFYFAANAYVELSSTKHL